MAKAHVLPPLSAAAAVMMSVAVVASLAAAPVSGNGTSPSVVEAPPPLLMAARGNRVDDQEPPEMDSEAHRRLAALARRGKKPDLGYGALNPNQAACAPNCGNPGQPYYPDHCQKIFHCRS
ncbi:hypothetical protein BS78_01G352800 [Paspalum vaginatum]|nr:hypothetical protein BS78_01G352800 [Paspalum vaginatum]